MASKFAHVTPAQVLEVSDLHKAYINDSSGKKVDLATRAYHDEKGSPWVCPIVRKVELMLANDKNNKQHQYLPSLGSDQFTTASMALLLGKNSKVLRENRAFGVQTMGCTGALAVGARFLVQALNVKNFYLPFPTWDGHEEIFLNAGFEKGIPYRYWHAGKRGLDMDGLLEDLSRAREHSVLILHAQAHNPTGCDPTPQQWAQIASVMKERKLLPFFNSAHLGLATGDLDRDASAVRYFVDQGFELLCAQSHSKPFALYGQRIGSLTFVMNSARIIPAIESQVQVIIQRLYRSPARHGSDVVSTILNDPVLFEEWKCCLKTMNRRYTEMRLGLRERMEKMKTPGSWDHITSQVGMHVYSGLTPKQMEYLRTKYHIYAPSNGWMNIGALNGGNLDYVASSIHDAVVNVPSRLVTV